MSVKKTDSSETLRTTDSMKRRAHLCERFVISLMKLFRLCGKRKQKPKPIVEKIQKNTAWCFFAQENNRLCFFKHPPFLFRGFCVFSPASRVSWLLDGAFWEVSLSPWAMWLMQPSLLRGGGLALWSRVTSSFGSCERGQTNLFLASSYWNC